MLLLYMGQFLDILYHLQSYMPQVVQTHLVAPLEKHFPLMYVLLKEHIADDADYKVKFIMKVGFKDVNHS